MTTETAEATVEAAPIHGGRLLVAEDDGPAATLLELVLTRVGYEVIMAPNGAVALQILEEEDPPDMLLLDWMLPEVSGLEICHRVRQKWDSLSLPILMVTARADPASISAAFDAGANDYITKPFLGAELRARVASHLRTRRLIEERRQMDEHLLERERLSALGLLVSSVAHDLNNPLAGISGFAQILLADEEVPSRADDLRRIVNEVQRCRRIVADLLSFARREPSERRWVRIRTIIEKTLSLHQRHLRSAGFHIDVRMASHLPGLVADAHQLQQVFLNILLNAQHALRSGGEHLEVTVELIRVSSSDVPWLSIEFSNDGPPISPEVLPNIFDPFFTTKSAEEGTGLGLAICQRIIKEHGGEIEVESGSQGTTFRVLLPSSGLDQAE
ncbi:MAG TPA: ATP-binding protein [Longimicrobiaceae bacterium]|nr:ATP-binding protein [Longimicrobiaceae bacterium]